MSKYTPMRFDVEKYDGRINFGLWQVQVKDVLIQSGLHKALKGKPAPVSSKESSAADHLSVLNNIVSELEAIRVKTLKYTDVTGKLLSEEKRLESSSHTSSSEGMVLVCGNGKKKHSQKTPVCWMCGKSGHVKRICPGGADSVKSSDTANIVSVVGDGDDFF
ncbi:hypothetical protein LXL04_006907 [Taraxacum kok-saghyz]